MHHRWRRLLMAGLAASFMLVVAQSASSQAQSQQALVERGAYIVTALNGCGCHTPQNRGRRIKAKFLSGGPENPPPKGPPQNTGWVRPTGWRLWAANITPDKATGIGAWSEADFIKLMRTGVRPDGTRIDPFMAWPDYQGMTDFDLKSIYAYMRTIPPVKNKVPAKVRVGRGGGPPRGKKPGR